jgi:hypothetical protein
VASAPGFWIAGLLRLTLLLALAPLRRRGRHHSALLAAGLLLLAWAVAHGPQLALAQPVIDARTFLPFGTVLASAVLFSEAATRRLGEERRLRSRTEEGPRTLPQALPPRARSQMAAGRRPHP